MRLLETALRFSSAHRSFCQTTDLICYREYRRGHVENLKTRIQTGECPNANMKSQMSLLRHSQQQSLAPSTESIASSQGTAAASACARELATDIGQLGCSPWEGTSERKYVGESSGVYFGKIVGTLLPGASQVLPADHPANLASGFGRRAEDTSSTAAVRTSALEPAPIPTADIANRLQEAFFSHRSSSLPFFHRPMFL
jgi:hypothetical protein